MTATRNRRAGVTGMILGILVACQCAAAQDDLKARIDNAKGLNVEELCVPVQSTRGGRVAYVPNPDGKTYDLLLRYYNDYWGPHTTFILDTASGKVEKHLVPKSLYSASTLGADGKLYGHRSGKEGKTIWVYDPAENRIVDLPNEAPVGGETQPIVVGTDGLIYGAGSGKGRACAYQLDPKSGRITDFGKLGPSHAPNRCWGYSVAADDRYVYVASGKIPWYVVAYDRVTKKDTVLLTMDDPQGHVNVGQGRYGCTASSRGHGKTTSYWLYKGRAIERKERKENPPWPVPEDAKPWVTLPPKPEVWLGRSIPKADGMAEVWCRPAGSKDDWMVFRYRTPVYPAGVWRVTALPDGRVFGSAGNYLGNFAYDPATGKHEHLGILPLSHYSTTVLGDKIYMSGYPSSALYVCDPAKPWTAGVSENPDTKPIPIDDPRSNPRRLLYLKHAGAGTHVMKAAVTGADGKAYFGGAWGRNGIGGGIGWWDPKTEKAGGIYEPFKHYQVMFMTTAGGGRYVVISTKTVRDQASGRPAPKEAKLFVFDTAVGKIIKSFAPLKDTIWTGAIAGVGGNEVLALTYGALAGDNGQDRPTYARNAHDTMLYKVDVITGEILFTKTLPYSPALRISENWRRQDGSDFRLGPDGKVWTYTASWFVPVNPEKAWHHSYLNSVLVRIDPMDGNVEVVGKLRKGGEMAFVGRDLYLSGGCRYLIKENHHLRRIKNIVPITAVGARP